MNIITKLSHKKNAPAHKPRSRALSHRLDNFPGFPVIEGLAGGTILAGAAELALILVKIELTTLIFC
jgi:hypothetical protein